MQLNIGDQDQRIDGQNNQQKISICLEFIPHLFRFERTRLSSFRFRNLNNPVALEIFQYLKSKILPKRKYSKSGRIPTRMKTEQKIKFIMRGMQNNLAKIYNRPPAKITNFSFQQQRAFFRRADVRRHFLEEFPKIIQEKKKSNEQRVIAIENTIVNILVHARTSQNQALKMFQNEIRRRQLPWTTDMFKDIQLFCQDIYRNFMKEPQKHSKGTIQMRYKMPKPLPKHLQTCLQELQIQSESQELNEATQEAEVKQPEINQSESTESETKANQTNPK